MKYLFIMQNNDKHPKLFNSVISAKNDVLAVERAMKQAELLNFKILNMFKLWEGKDDTTKISKSNWW